MIEELLKNLTLEPLENWGPQPIQREEFKDIPVGFYNRFEKISSCDLNLFLQKKAFEDQDNFIKVNTADKKLQKNPANIVRNKLFIKKRNEVRNQQIYKHYSQKWTKNFVKAKQVSKTKFKESLTIKNDWNQLADIRANFDKEIDGNVTVECFKEVGVLKALRPEIEKISRRQYKLDYKQGSVDTHFTENDRVLKSLAIKYYENEPERKTVILLPQFLTAIMTLKFSVYPWHISINKQGNLITMNSYEGEEPTYLDMYAVNENTQNNMPDESYILQNSMMATQVAKSFKYQIASGDVIQEVEYQPEEDEEDEQQQELQEGDSFKKYVKISIGDTDFYTFAEVDGAKVIVDPITQEERTKYYLTKSLIEIQSNYEWKKKFEKTGAGDVISGEYLANNVNWQKWFIESHLASAENFKIAYISQNKDKVFNILNVMELPAKSINQNLRFNIKRCWNVLKTVVDSLFEGADGNYILMKSAYNTNLSLYEIPAEEQEDENEQ